jgi:WD40 repeat protein
LAPALTIQAEAPLSDFTLSPSGSEIAAVLRDGRIRVWSVAGEALRSWPANDPPVQWILYAGSSRLVAGAAGSMMVLDASSGKRLASWSSADVQGAASTPEGELIAGACGDGSVRLWKSDGTAVRTLRAPGLAEITRGALSRGGRRIAVCGTDADVRLFDARTGAVEHVLDLTMTSFALDFSPDGGTLATGGVDGSVTLWDAESGRVTATLGRYSIGVGAVRFSADGKHLASSGLSINPATAEAEARVCDLATRKESSMPLGVSTWNAVGFSPDGKPFVVDVHGQTLTLRELG